jgi:hypothetical protein
MLVLWQASLLLRLLLVPDMVQVFHDLQRFHPWTGCNDLVALHTVRDNQSAALIRRIAQKLEIVRLC